MSQTTFSAPQLVEVVGSHLRRLIDEGAARFGPRPTAMWMASIDPHTGRYPLDDTRPADFPKRAYRNIDAPHGCSAYWDQPQLAAAHRLGHMLHDACFDTAVDDYIRDFLTHCVSQPTGLLLWGNHYYWDPYAGCVRKFKSDEAPQAISADEDMGEFHEARPITPAWDLLARVDPAATERAIRAMAQYHLCDEQGTFNRHADRQPHHAFLEAGGVLVESFAWLAARQNDEAMLDLARRVARFSHSFRNATTGLMPVSPLAPRWDAVTCTSEVGLWARCLIQAMQMTGEQTFGHLAADVVSAYLHHAWDERQHNYRGKLGIVDGQPTSGKPDWPYQPADYVDLWHPLFPRHDYPMEVAHACVELYHWRGEPIYLKSVQRWLDVIQRSLPARAGQGGYAEHYGRCLRFAVAAAPLPGCAGAHQLAEQLAHEAIDQLYVNGMFRGHAGEDRYDAIDGVGFLLHGLLDLAAATSDSRYTYTATPEAFRG